MAGTHLTLDIPTNELGPAIGRLVRFGSDGLDLLYRDIGEYLLLAHDARFAAEISPAGEPWAPLSPRYQKKKERLRPGLKKLVYDNFLKGTLRYQIDGGDLFFGTNQPYGAIQQFGGSEGMAPGAAAIPARPWLGLSAADDEEVLAITGDHLKRAAEGK